jgi:DNA-binding NtrC family response regulator
VTATKRTLLLVEDEASLRKAIATFFEHHGFEVASAATCAEADVAVNTTLPDVAVVDYQLPDGDGISLLSRWRATQPPFPTVFMTAHGSIDLAVRATKEGAEHFLTKPVELPALLAVIEIALDGGWRRRREQIERERESSAAPDPFLGASAAIRELRRRAEAMIDVPSPILLQGETGTG